jgi:hypothetical protein
MLPWVVLRDTRINGCLRRRLFWGVTDVEEATLDKCPDSLSVERFAGVHRYSHLFSLAHHAHEFLRNRYTSSDISSRSIYVEVSGDRHFQLISCR